MTISAPAGGKPASSFKLRPLLFQIHLYVAIAIAPFVVIVGVTGAIMAFETQIARLPHADVAYVTPAPPRLSLAELAKAVAKAYPGQKIRGYFIGDAPNLSTEVAVGRMSVFVNPYTGKILGDGRSRVGDLVDEAIGAIHSIHQRLTLPRPGRDGLTRFFMSWVTAAALFLLLSGIYLWWPRMRFAIGKRGGRPFWYDLHATLGIAAAAFLILLAVSGMFLGFTSLPPLLYTLSGSKPAIPTMPKMVTVPGAVTEPIPIDRAFAIASNALHDATPFEIVGPTPSGYVVRARTPDDHSANGASQAVIDPYTGTVLSMQISDSAPAGTRLLALNRAIHTGSIFGISSQILMSLASLIIAIQVGSGVMMWIRRVSFRKMLPALALTAAVTAIAIYTIFAPTS